MTEDLQRMIEKVRVEIQEGKSDEEIFQNLLYGKDSKIYGDLAEWLPSIPDVKIVRLLHRMFESSEEKKIRKIIKRSLYRLKAKGISTEEVSLEKGKSILHPLQILPEEGYGSSLDFLGQRFLLLTIPPRGGRRLTVMQGVVSDTQGFVDFSGEEMGRKRFKEFFHDIQEKNPFPLIEIEPSYVGFLFSEAYRLSIAKGVTPPQDYLGLRKEIDQIKKEYERPLIYSFLQADEIVGNEWLLRKGEDLLKVDLFKSWRIEEDQIRPYADAVWEAEESKLLLNQTQKEARFQGIYQKALSELFGEERRSSYKRRLEEMAYVLFKLGKGEEAKISLAAAIDLEKTPSPFQPNPFLYQLVVKSIFLLLAEAYEGKAKEPTLIVKP